MQLVSEAPSPGRGIDTNNETSSFQDVSLHSNLIPQVSEVSFLNVSLA